MFQYYGFSIKLIGIKNLKEFWIVTVLSKIFCISIGSDDMLLMTIKAYFCHPNNFLSLFKN